MYSKCFVYSVIGEFQPRTYVDFPVSFKYSSSFLIIVVVIMMLYKQCKDIGQKSNVEVVRTSQCEVSILWEYNCVSPTCLVFPAEQSP